MITCDRCRKPMEVEGYRLSANGPPEEFDLCTNCRWDFYNVFMFKTKNKFKKSKYVRDMEIDDTSEILLGC